MDVHEYQAKEMLAKFGVAVPRGAVAHTPEQAVYAATELGGSSWVVKAQIHAGGRSQAGGIKMCGTYHDVRKNAADLLGKRLVTAQTGPDGKLIQRVYVEQEEKFEREFYFSFVLDRKTERINIRCSRPVFSRAAMAAGCGTWTAMSSSNMAWGFGPSGSGTPTQR